VRCEDGCTRLDGSFSHWREIGKNYNASRFWFHLAICPSTRTSAVFAVVSVLNTVTKRFLLRRGCFLIFGTLLARRTKQKIKNYRGIKKLGFITNLSPQRVARIVFRAIRRFECCSRMVLDRYHYTKEGIGAPSSSALRCRGRTGSRLEQSFVTGHLLVRTHSGTFGYTPHIVE
jgi:hypothetical protein